MSTDSIADLLTRIRNAQSAGHHTVLVRLSKMNKSILEVLRSEGYISSYEERDADDGGNYYEVGLKYGANGKPIIQTATRVSKPGVRSYAGANDIPRVECGLGVALVSTSQGVMSDKEARQKNIGGEVLAFIS